MADRLGSLDATFLELEEAHESAHMHLGALMIFEGGHAAPPPLEELRARMDERTALLPHYRCRLSAQRVGALRRPSWEPDPEFSIEAHVRDASLPAPGGESALMDWCGEYWSSRLDRTRPLWELVRLEGLEGGRWALATKTHHAMVDGVGSVEVTQLLLDSSRSRSLGRSGPPSEPVEPAEAVGGPSLAQQLGDLVRAGATLVTQPGRLLEEAAGSAQLLLRDELMAAPHTSLNVPTGGHRRYALARARLSDVKAIKSALGGTVNDVVLSVCAGGLRRLLLERGEQPPEQGLRAMVPVNVRLQSDPAGSGNRVSSLFVELPVYEPDPLRRHLVTTGNAEELKAGPQARSGADLLALSGLAPPLLHSLLVRPVLGRRLFNLTVTNVPGPPAALYAFGSKLEEVAPYVPLAADHALGIAVVSYDGKVFFGLGGDARATPDLDVLRAGIEESLHELRRLARRRGPKAGS